MLGASWANYTLHNRVHRMPSGECGQTIGRSRRGLTTKVHALVDALGNPFNLVPTPGQDHDLTCAQPLLKNADPRALIGDKAYDADSFIDALDQQARSP